VQILGKGPGSDEGLTELPKRSESVIKDNLDTGSLTKSKS
tara:strand:- start:53 stop:172 length:120 start_codon:yes stop_codon:yes gene_type:complete